MTSIPLEELEAQAPFLRRLARALVRDEDAAADLVQETWLAALRHGPREGEEARGWLARLLRTRARSSRRGDARRSARERAAAHGGGRRVRGGGSGPEVAERVLAAVLALEEPGKSAILRRYYEDLAPSAIAERTGTPLKTVEARLARARAELRRRLDGDFGGRANWGVALAALAGLERPARLTSGALILAAAGLCGAAAVGWRFWRAPQAVPRALPTEIARAVTPPPAEAPAELAAPPAAVEAVREPEPPATAAAAPAPVPAEALDEGLRAREAALVTGRVEGGGLVAPWVAVLSRSSRHAALLAARPVDPTGSFAVEVSLKGLSGTVYLLAIAEQRLPVWRELWLQPGKTREANLALLDVGAPAAGFVIEPSSAPIPGATARIWRPYSYSTFRVGPYELAFEGTLYALATQDIVADRRGRFEAFGFTAGQHRAAVLAEEELGLETVHLLERNGGMRVDLPDAALALTAELDELRIEIQGPEGPVDGIALFHGERREVEGCLAELDRLESRARAEGKAAGPKTRKLGSEGIGDPLAALTQVSVPESGRLRLAFERSAKPLVLIRRAGFKTLALELADAAPGGDGWLHLMLEPTLEQPVLALAVDASGEIPSAFELVLTSAATGLEWVPPIRRVLTFAEPILVHDVGPGKYALELKPLGPSSFVPVHAEVEVDSMEPRTEVALKLVRGGTVRLVALGGAASPLGVELVLERGESERLVCVPLDARELQPGQRAELAPCVPPGRWSGRLLGGGRTLWQGEARIEAGGVLDVPLDAR